MSSVLNQLESGSVQPQPQLQPKTKDSRLPYAEPDDTRKRLQLLELSQLFQYDPKMDDPIRKRLDEMSGQQEALTPFQQTEYIEALRALDGANFQFPEIQPIVLSGPSSWSSTPEEKADEKPDATSQKAKSNAAKPESSPVSEQSKPSEQPKQSLADEKNSVAPTAENTEVLEPSQTDANPSNTVGTKPSQTPTKPTPISTTAQEPTLQEQPNPTSTPNQTPTKQSVAEESSSPQPKPAVEGDTTTTDTPWMKLPNIRNLFRRKPKNETAATPLFENGNWRYIDPILLVPVYTPIFLAVPTANVHVIHALNQPLSASIYLSTEAARYAISGPSFGEQSLISTTGDPILLPDTSSAVQSNQPKYEVEEDLTPKRPIPLPFLSNLFSGSSSERKPLQIPSDPILLPDRESAAQVNPVSSLFSDTISERPLLQIPSDPILLPDTETFNKKRLTDDMPISTLGENWQILPSNFSEANPASQGNTYSGSPYDNSRFLNDTSYPQLMEPAKSSNEQPIEANWRWLTSTTSDVKSSVNAMPNSSLDTSRLDQMRWYREQQWGDLVANMHNYEQGPRRDAMMIEQRQLETELAQLDRQIGNVSQETSSPGGFIDTSRLDQMRWYREQQWGDLVANMHNYEQGPRRDAMMIEQRQLETELAQLDNQIGA